MKTVIVTCSPYGNLEKILPLLQQAGLEQQNDIFVRWHDTFFGPSGSVEPLDGDLESLPQAQAAESIAAMSSAMTGDYLLLTDSRCLWTIGFWAAQLPEATFLLLYSRAEAALVYAGQQGLEPGQALDDWQAASRQLVRFHRGHRRRAFVIETEAAMRNPQALLDIFRRIGLTPQPLPQPLEPAAEQPLVELYLARQLVVNQPAIQALQAELEASSQPLGDAVSLEIPPLALFNEQCRQLVRHRTLRQELDETAHKLSTAEQALQQQNSQQLQLQTQIDKLTEARDEQVKLNTAQRVELESIRQAQSTLEETSKQSAQENELLLLQLHQMQDELEKVFLEKDQLEQQKRKDEVVRQEWQARIDQLTKSCDQQAKVNTNQRAELEKTYQQKEQIEKKEEKGQVARQQLQSQVDQLQTQIDQLTKARNQQAKVTSKQRAELEKVRQERKSLIAASKESAKENERLLQRLHQVQEELEKTYLQKEQLEKKDQNEQVTRQQLQSQVEQLQTQIDQLDTQIVQLTKARDQQAKLNTEQRTELEKVRQAHRSLKEASQVITHEKVLLLQQLHQVQEGLEKVFLQKQQLERQKQQLKQQKLELEQQSRQLVETVRNEKDLELQQVKDELLNSAREIERLHQRVNKLKQSVSWKITAPMRIIARPFNKMSKDESNIREQVKLLKSSGLFDEAWYTATNDDVAGDGYDPVEHYVRFGAAEGRDPSPAFSTRRYLEINPDVAENGMNPLFHFVKYGQAENRIIDRSTREDKPVEP